MPPDTKPVLAVRLSRPFRQFAEWQAGGGVMLLVAASIAMLLANSAGHAAVEAFWETPLALTFGSSVFSLTLREWISDGLMAVFFLLVGLEIKSELLVGELSTLRTASLPLAAALGGMLAPALIYVALNRGTDGAAGWGIPTATDIAFALGVLALLGSRVPPALTVFLAALAIADDLGAVLVISLFYGHAPDATYLLLAGAVMLALVSANLAGVAWTSVYAILGLALWYCVLRSGVHSTVAGVLLALTVPARSRIEPARFEEEARRHLDDFATATGEDDRPVLSNGGQQHALAAIESAVEDAQPPLARMRHVLHVPVNFWIMSLFALANAGVRLVGDSGAAGTALVGPVSLGVALGLVLGKPLGILLATWLATRFGATLPGGSTWASVSGVACLAGIGFTMSLFVSGLAFPDAVLLAQAKAGIVAASLLAGTVGAAVMWWATAPARIAAPAPAAATGEA
ncbi:MAG: Na+/H+ antiporter NhaA [Gemmatimonadaceae bacterium]|nr:Na+/H+ antiporter NhaA [Gemmatimonadaceae bacterium]